MRISDWSSDVCSSDLFAGYAVLGSNGILAWGDYSRALATHRQELQKIKAERDRLKNRVDLVDPRHADPDMADELVRRELTVTNHDAVIVPLRFCWWNFDLFP